MNLNKYTEFKNVQTGDKFIDADNHEYMKVSENQARHYDRRYSNGYVDYPYDADDRVRVQP
jgi:hypothetical protein